MGVALEGLDNNCDDRNHDERNADILDDRLATFAVTQVHPSGLNSDLESEQGVVVHVDLPLCFVMSE